MTNSSSKLEFKALTSYDPKRRQPDINLAKKVLGWEPKTSLDEGLRKTVVLREFAITQDTRHLRLPVDVYSLSIFNGMQNIEDHKHAF